MDKTLIGAYIKQQREDRGWTQNFLYEGICSRATLSRIENDTQAPSFAVLKNMTAPSCSRCQYSTITAPGPQEFPAARGRGGHFCSLRYRLTRLSSSWRVSSRGLSPAK